MNTNQASLASTTLESDYFVSPEVWERESERIFDNHWLAVANAKSFERCGAFQRKLVEGRDLFLIRGRDHRIRAFFNSCRHRGTAIVERDCGTEKSGCVTCPYHAWRYDDQGHLVAAPNMREVPKFEKGEHGLKEIACDVALGQVFINFSQSPTDLSDQVSRLETRLAPWKVDELQPVRCQEYVVAANWKLIGQNYNECYHCPHVHPALNQLTPYRESANDLQSGPILGGPMFLADGAETMSQTGKLVGTLLKDLSGEERRQVRYYSMFPSLLISAHPDYVMVHRLSRLAPGKTRVECEFLFDPDVAAESNFDASPATDFWDTVNRQDWHVCELSQLGIESGGYQPGPYSTLESLLVEYDRNYLAILGDDGFG